MLVSTNDYDTFSDTYGCIFTACIGYQSPFPLVRFGDRLDSRNETRAVAMIRQSGLLKSPLTWRLLSLDFSEKKPCSSFEQLLSKRNHFLELMSENQKLFRSIDQWRQVTGIAFRTCTNNFCASFYHQPPQLALTAKHVAVEGVQSLSFTDSEWFWCASSRNPVTIFSLNMELLFSEAMVKKDFSVELCSSGSCSIESVMDSTCIVFHEKGVCTVDKRKGKQAHVQHYMDENHFCSGGMSGEHYLVCSTKSGEVFVFDRRKVSNALLRQGLGTLASIRSHSKDNVALLVTQNHVGILDVISLKVLGSVQSREGDILDATVSQSTPNTIHLCTTESNGMLYDWCMEV